MEKLSENIYKLYLRDKIKSIKNKSLYTLTCTMIIQSFIGNEKSFKFSFIVGFISALSGLLSNISCIINKENYEESVQKLQNVAKELTLLGYDLDNNAMLDCTIYSDGLVEYYDKHDNKYFLYETEENGETKYYSFISDDVEECLNDSGMHEDITKVIKRGLNKSKQSKN